MSEMQARKIVASILQDPVSTQYLIKHLIDNPLFIELLGEKILAEERLISDLMEKISSLVDRDYELVATKCTRTE